MKVVIAIANARPAWTGAIDVLERELRAYGWAVARGDIADWLRGDRADSYVVVSGRDEDYGALLAACAKEAPDRLPRTVLLGCNLGWEFASGDHAPGTLPFLLEQYGLGGAFRIKALEAWQEAPSPFLGLSKLMPAMQTNAFKGFSSANYCAWFAARGTTLGAFLVSYLPLLDEFIRTGWTSEGDQ